MDCSQTQESAQTKISQSIVPSIYRLLSKEKLPFSKVLIAQQYYLNIPNQLEDELNDDESEIKDLKYPLDLKIDAEGENFASCSRYVEMMQLLTYFQVESNIQADLLLECLGFQRMRFYQKGNQDILTIMNIETNRCLRECVQKVFATEQRQKQLKKQLNQIIKQKLLALPSIFSIQMQPLDFKQLKELLIESNGECEFSKYQINKFQDWNLLKYKSKISIFFPCYDPVDSNNNSATRIQELIDKRTNNLELSIPEIENLKLYLEQVNQNNYNNQFNTLFQGLQNLKQSVDHSFENTSVRVFMREVKGKLRLATKDSHLQFYPFLFSKPALTFPKISEKDLKNLASLIHSRISESIIIYLDIKDFTQNINYDLIEHLLGYKQIAEYLRIRKVEFKDEISKKKVQIQMKKGILIGEVFQSFITQTLSDYIFILIKNYIETFIRNELGSLVRIFSYSFCDDMILIFEPNSINLQQNDDFLNYFEDPNLVKDFLSVINTMIQEQFGLELNNDKTRLLVNRFETRNTWKFNPSDEIVQSDNFIVMKKDLLNFKSFVTVDNLENETRLLQKLFREKHTNLHSQEDKIKSNSLKEYLIALLAKQKLDSCSELSTWMPQLPFIEFLKSIQPIQKFPIKQNNYL